MTYSIGTVSHGTLLADHLIQAFVAELPASHRLRQDYEAYGYNVAEADELVDELIDALDTLAPEGTYFGTHPGDGSDFGFWPVELLA